MPKDVKPPKKVTLVRDWKSRTKKNGHYNKTFDLFYGHPEKEITKLMGKVLYPIPRAGSTFMFEVTRGAKKYPKYWFKEVKE